MMVYSPKNFWDRYAAKKRYPWSGEDQYEELNQLTLWIGEYLDSGGQVLDVGSGWGRFAYFCRGRGVANLKITMCDISAVFARQAFDVTHGRPVLWDGKDLPFGDNTFDLVVAQSFFLHVQPGNIEHVWNELLRVTSTFMYVASMDVELTDERKKKNEEVNTWCFAHDYKKLIEDSGVEVLETRKFSDMRTAWWLRKVL